MYHKESYINTQTRMYTNMLYFTLMSKQKYLDKIYE